jgi:hypothetical protein
MATSSNVQIVDDFQTTIASTPQIAYTSPATGKGTIITNCSASNNTPFTRSYAAYVTSDTGVPGNPEIPSRNISTKETDISPELSGRFMPPGSELYFETSAAGSISFFVSGREFI